MKTLFVLYLIGVLSPLHPAYPEFVKANGGHPVVVITQTVQTEAECGAAMQQEIEEGKKLGFSIAYVRCVGVDYLDPDKVKGL